ncbi:amidase family protein [Microbacterium sp. M4A5_1d]
MNRRLIVPAAAVGALLTCGVAAPAAAVPAVAAAAAPTVGAAFLAPYYTELDLTGDDRVTTDDLAVVAAFIGSTDTDADWAEAGAYDLDGDGAITASDIALVSERAIYDDGPFEIVEADVVSMQAAMNAGVVTSVELTQQYLDRIAAYDRAVIEPGGRPLNSIITTGDAAALAAAASADTVRAEQGMTSMLLGVPIAVKDNYNTVDMPTTAGCGCWNDNRTASDAHMVEGLRADGAVILAKASMDEFAINLSSQWSAYQPAGTALTVSSPYATNRSSGGSSGGTGAAIASNLAAIGFGTDTGGSIRIPSTYNQLVGVRPTVGLASRDGIVPLALSQDTGGPMARSVTDAAVALDAVVGADSADPVTARQEGLVPASYTASLDADALRGARIAVITGLPTSQNMVGSNATTQRLFSAARETLEAQGAEVVELAAPEGFSGILGEGSGSAVEFGYDLQAYIDDYLNPAVGARSLAAIAQSPNIAPNRGASTYGPRSTVTPQQYEDWAGPAGSHTLQLARGKQVVTEFLDANDIDAIIYPSGTPYGTVGSNMRLSPNTGLPAVTVPMGQASATEQIPGAGVNLEFLGRDFAEGTLLGLAFSFEQATGARTTPALYGPLPAG